MRKKGMGGSAVLSDQWAGRETEEREEDEEGREVMNDEWCGGGCGLVKDGRGGCLYKLC